MHGHYVHKVNITTLHGGVTPVACCRDTNKKYSHHTILLESCGWESEANSAYESEKCGNLCNFYF